MALPPPQEFTAKQQPILPNELLLVQRESRPQHDQEEPKAERVERETLNPNAKSWVPLEDGEIDRKPRLKSFDALKAGEMTDVKPVLRDPNATLSRLKAQSSKLSEFRSSFSSNSRVHLPSLCRSQKFQPLVATVLSIGSLYEHSRT